MNECVVNVQVHWTRNQFMWTVFAFWPFYGKFFLSLYRQMQYCWVANTDFFQIFTYSSLVIPFPPYPLLYNLCRWKSLLSDRINYLRTLCFLLDVLAKLQTVTAVSFVMCIHPHGTTGLALDGFSWNLKLKIYGKSGKKIQVWLKCDKNNGYFRWRPM